MSATRHDQVKDIFLAACLLPASERSALLDRSCDGDDPLRREVESLLAFHEEEASQAAQVPARGRRRAQPKGRYRRGHIVAGRYRIERMVGRGGMGEVYEAYDGMLRQSVALKILHVTNSLHQRRLVEEVRLARQVTHPGVCRVHDVGEHEGSPFLTMELIEGVDLAARLARSGPLRSDEVVDIGVRLCEALAAAHEAGVLHRDLKPANILVDRKGGLYITDFGIATPRVHPQDARAADPTRFGTPVYMAPEETEANGSVTERTDLYSLGLVLYELTTGAPPFDASDPDVLLELQRSALPEPPSRRVPGVDITLETVILRLLAKDPAARPESARAVMTALVSERAPRMVSDALPSRRERRPTLTLLCELTAPPSTMSDPEWPELVRIFKARCNMSCRLMGGQIIGHRDRGLIVRFGLPATGERYAESAVLAGLEMVAEARERPLLSRERSPLSVAVVIETGSVAVQSGRVVESHLNDEIARLESMVEPNAVVVSAAALPLVRDLFAHEPVEHRDGGQTKYRITGARRRLGLQTGAARLTPFSGRELELARLERWWREADNGKGQVVLVTGEAGLGKSRIVHELWQRTRPGAVGLEARGSSLHQNTPLFPFVEMITNVFGLDHADTGEARETKLRQGLAALGPRAEELLPAFSDWLLPAGGSPLATTGAARGVDRRVLIGAILEWILALAETKPILLVCEDVHWSDPTSREAIDQLVDQIRLSRVMLVLTFRPEFSPPWRGTAINHIALQPMSADEMRALVAAVPGDTTQNEASIVDRADGNPLFFEELMKDVGEARQGSAVGVPLTLQSLLAARLDRLGPAKRLAQAAAVCGRTFRYPLLAALAADDERHEIDLEAGLVRLRDAEIVFQRGTPPRASFTFKHALLQEAAYDSLPSAHRRRWHALLARVIPDVEPEIAATQPEVIARHWAKAGRTAEAFEWWRRAGVRAHERSAYAEAIHAFEQALRALPRAVPPTERREREIELRMALTAAEAGRSPGSDAMRRHARRVEALCAGLDASDQLVTALFLSARSRMVRGEMRAAMRIFDRVRLLAGDIREPYLRAAVYSEIASLLSLSVRLAEGDHFFDLCRESYAQAGPKPAASFTLDPLVCAHFGKALREWLRGRHSSARRSLDEGIQHADWLGQPFSQAFIRLYGGGIALLMGDAERARSLVIRGARLASGVDSIGLLAFANVLEPALEPIAASDRVTRIEKALHDHEQAGHRGMRSLGIAGLARVLEDEGRLEEALVAMVSATSEAARGEDVFLLSEMLRRRGELLARLGRVGEAEVMLRRSLRVARRGGASGLELRATLSLARWLAGEGRGAAARRALESMLAGLPGDVDMPERAEAARMAGLRNNAVSF